jgi:hypothetical protein
MVASSVVSVFQPRQRSFQEAVDSYWSGNFSFFARFDLYDINPLASALSARGLIRLGRPEDALAVAEAAVRGIKPLSHAEKGELLTHIATARARLRTAATDLGDLFSEARIYAYASAISALEAEFLVREAYALLMVGDDENARSRALAVLDLEQTAGEPNYFCPIQHSRARAHDVLAFLSANVEHYTLQKAHLQAALAECGDTESRDAAFEANLLSNLAIFAVDFGDDGYVRERLNRLPESNWLAPQRYEILRSLGWSNALRGDNLGAFRDLRDASEIACTTPRRMRATLDRAYFARMLNQHISAREELDYAERLGAKVDWDSAASDEGELTALLHLSQELAFSVPLRARRMFDRYRSLKPRLSAGTLAISDRRARAEELVVDATISKEEGSEGRAIALFLDAFNIWDSLGYGVRAALVARELAALGAGERFAEYAAKEAALRPRSWLATSLANRPAVSV